MKRTMIINIIDILCLTGYHHIGVGTGRSMVG